MADSGDQSKSPRINIDDTSRPSYPLEKMRGRQSERRRQQADAVHEKSGRVPPQATDVEMSVLGAMLIEREAIPKAIEVLPPEAFYSSKHQKIYESILNLFERGNPVDLVTLTEELKRRDALEDVGGAYYLTELTTQVASAANVEYHARIIAEKSLLRKMIEKMTTLVGKAYESGADAFELLDEAESEIFSISDTQLRKAASPLNDVVKDTLERLESIHGQKGGITGVPSGFTKLDDMTSGWQPSDLIIIAARPSMGKCLGKGTPVMMADGQTKLVEDIEVGDRLMGDDGAARTVQSLARGREQMYWVRQKRGIDYRVNESHILSLKKSRRGGRKPRGSVTDISVRDYLKKSDKWKNDNKGFKAPASFPKHPVPMDPYLLGLWLGDGKSDNARIYSTDEEVISYLHEYAEARGDTVRVHDADRACPAYLIKSGDQGLGDKEHSVQAILRALGVLGDKHIPHLYLGNSRENRLRLLAGLIDTDGHRNAGHGGTYEITQSNRRLAEQIKYLCDTLGYRTSLKGKTARIASTGYESTVYRVRFNGNVDEIPVRVERKKAKPWTDRRDWRVTGIEVEPDGEGDYYGFTLDGNGRFLLADGTVTHNTAFSLATAMNAAMHPTNPAGVAIFSLEMGAQQLAQRLLTSEARVDAQRARTGRMKDDDWQRLARAAGKLSEANIFIDDTPGLSVLELRAKCRRLKAEHDIGLVVVDYLQLMQASGGLRSGANREQEIAHISRSLKGLAKELNLPVIALSQLNRSVENRGGDKRPQLSDLRESGSIEQDADVVSFIYRAERYGITVDENGNSTEGIAEIIIGKQRNGPIGTVELAFIDRYALFENLTSKYNDNDQGGFGGGGYDDDYGGGDGYDGGQQQGGGNSFEDDAPF
jgi:replicative DNA helicase